MTMLCSALLCCALLCYFYFVPLPPLAIAAVTCCYCLFWWAIQQDGCWVQLQFSAGFKARPQLQAAAGPLRIHY